MAHVVEVHGLVGVCARLALNRLIDQTGHRVGPVHTVMFELDGLSLHTRHLADKWCQMRHGTAGLAAGDRRQSIALGLIATLIDDDANRPVAVGHRAGREASHDEIEAVEVGPVEMALLDLKGKCKGATALGWTSGETTAGAGTEEIATAALKVLSADLPVGHGRLLARDAANFALAGACCQVSYQARGCAEPTGVRRQIAIWRRTHLTPQAEKRIKIRPGMRLRVPRAMSPRL